MQRLTQIVICGGKEARLRAARFFSADARFFGDRILATQLLDELLVFNANSNLRPSVAAAFGFDPFERVVDFLEQEVRRCRVPGQEAV